VIERDLVAARDATEEFNRAESSFLTNMSNELSTPLKGVNRTRFRQSLLNATRRHGGTALGLAVSRNFCRAMGGGIAVGSETGVGSAFTIQLPLSPLRASGLIERMVRQLPADIIARPFFAGTFFLVIAPCFGFQAAVTSDAARWEKQAARVTIFRDDHGIAHVYGKTDADAVFGMIYSQAEDDFNRVETNYLNSMGRLAEAEGESKIYQDLRMKMFIGPADLKKQYAASPVWLKALMNAFADGLNFYLSKHPQVKPRVITRFEPWMALSFTEGSIGGDIERVNLNKLEAFYGKNPLALLRGEQTMEKEPSGSNGMAIAPANTAAHHALLLINPHTSFFFRSELQMVSEQGLNAYGAVTWGQFFIYQGFNERAGWMHTSSGVDAVDEYLETVTKKGDRFFYRHGKEERPLSASEITVSYKIAGGMAQKKFTVYRTSHGPVTHAEGEKWVTIRLMQKPVKALMQSYTRTKATTYQAYRQTMELKANSSNNTIFADADGDIAYFHGNYIPRRDTAFDWTKPVDGSNPATEWKGLLTVDEAPNLLNPKSGWLYNTNNWPWSAAGESSLKKADYPAYVESGGESARGLHAIRVLQNKKDFTLDSLIAAAYDSYLTWFEKPVPALIKAWDSAPAGDPLKAKTAEQIALLRQWDLRWAVDSVPTSLAVFWGEDMRRRAGPRADAEVASPQVMLQSLAAASERLTNDFGKWNTPWGDINRFQRLTGDIVQPFNDADTSIPVGFTSAVWGSLASFGARPYPNTKKWYGTSGNSFVAVVEFGDKVRAKAVTAGGESGNPASKHFNDQAGRYATGDLREVYFYRSQLQGHTEREYHPGT
jgi:acyl-homoserine-lactone acylase